MEEVLFHSFVSFAAISALIIIAPFLSNLTRIPVVVIEIILGSLAIYFGFLKSNEVISIFAKIGFLYLMFLCGMEVELRGFRNKGKHFFKKIALYFSIIYAITIIVTLSLNLPKIFIVALPVMSVGMMMTLIRTYGKDEIWLNMSLTVGIIGELLSIIALVFMNGIHLYGVSFELGKTILVLLGFIAIIAGFFMVLKILFWWFPTLRELIMPSVSNHNQDVRFSVMLFLMLIVIVMSLELESVLGAFLAGMVIVNFFPYKHELIHKLNDIGFGFFIPLFFINVGTTVDVNAILHNPKLLLYGAIIALYMLALHMIASFFCFKKYLSKTSDLLLHSFANCMPLTFLVAIATFGYEIKALSTDAYYSFLLAAMMEGVVFIVIIKLLYSWRSYDKNY